MNPVSAPVPEVQSDQAPQNVMSEIPSFPTTEPYIPQQEVAVYSPVPEYTPQPQSTTEIRTAHTEAKSVPQSTTPELQTNIAYETTRAGERVFVNPDLGQSSFKGGVSTTQMLSKVAGYYTVQQGLTSDPKSGLLQQTASTGDPTNATTWQATILMKILQAFWNVLGIE